MRKMIATILIITIALFWLLIETNFLTIRLPYGKKLSTGMLMLNPGKVEPVLMLYQPKFQSSVFIPSIVENNDLPVSKTIVNVGAKLICEFMKIQCLTENLIKALSQIKENKVVIFNVVVSRKLLLEALKINKDIPLVEIESGKIIEGYRGFDGEFCKVTSQQSTLKFGLERTTFKLFGQTLDYKDICNGIARIDFTHSQSKQGIEINSGLLLEALNYVMPCIATEVARPALNCILFDSTQDNLKLVTADGFRLATTQIPVNGLPTDKVLIDDIKTLHTFLKSIKPEKTRIGKTVRTEYPNIKLLHEDETLKFSSDNSSILLDKVDCKFPDYEQIIPANEGFKIEFYSNDMLQAVNSLKNIASQSSGIIRMQFFKIAEIGADKCLLSAKSEEFGANTVEIDCKVSEDCKFALNYRYLLAYLNTVKNSMVTMYITSASSPAKFEVGNKVEVIMPMFVAWDNEKSEPKTEPIIEDGEELTDEPEDLETYLNEKEPDEILIGE